MLDALEITQQKPIDTFRQEGKRGGQWGCEEGYFSLHQPPHVLGAPWVDTTSPLTMAHLLAPLQTPDFSHQPLHRLRHAQKDLLTLCSKMQAYIQVAQRSSSPRGHGCPITLLAMTSASFFCWKAGLVPTSWESPTTAHPPPIAPKPKQRFSGWARNRAQGFPSRPKAETAQRLQVKTHFSHLASSPSRKI